MVYKTHTIRMCLGFANFGSETSRLPVASWFHEWKKLFSVICWVRQRLFMCVNSTMKIQLIASIMDDTPGLGQEH